jgi:hypothetical protein
MTKAKLPLAVAALVLLLGLHVEVNAQIVVFHSPNNDGMDPGGMVPIESAESVTLHLYIDNPGAATATGTVCEDGDGNELCGYDLTLEALGGFEFTGFNEVANTSYSLTDHRVRLNVVEAIDGISGPAYIGDLIVTAISGTTVDLSRGQALDASLSLIDIAPRSLISLVPEAGFLPLLGSGLLLLLALGRGAR